MNHAALPVAVIGAGPVGLAAAAHLLIRGETPLVLEAGDGPRHSIRQWAHVPMFSPWEFNTDKAAVALLSASGWKPRRTTASRPVAIWLRVTWSRWRSCPRSPGISATARALPQSPARAPTRYEASAGQRPETKADQCLHLAPVSIFALSSPRR